MSNELRMFRIRTELAKSIKLNKIWNGCSFRTFTFGFPYFSGESERVTCEIFLKLCDLIRSDSYAVFAESLCMFAISAPRGAVRLTAPPAVNISLDSQCLPQWGGLWQNAATERRSRMSLPSSWGSSWQNTATEVLRPPARLRVKAAPDKITASQWLLSHNLHNVTRCAQKTWKKWALFWLEFKIKILFIEGAHSLGGSPPNFSLIN